MAASVSCIQEDSAATAAAEGRKECQSLLAALCVHHPDKIPDELKQMLRAKSPAKKSLYKPPILG